MEAADLLGLAIPLTYLVMLGVEQWRPARRFPAVAWWRSTGALFVLLLLSLNVVLPLLLPVEWAAAHRLFDLSFLGVIGGAVIGWLVLSLANFAWHRAEHAFNPLWRGFHQLHHSPQRVDISGAAFTHPSEMAMLVVVSLGVTVFLLGLDPLAAAIVGYVAAFYAMFQHWNIRTPGWLGYVIQRPESHCLHHERDVHARNFADFPLWDIIFGSFHNPPAFAGRVGFDDGVARRIGAMLAGTDVNGSGSLGRPGAPLSAG
jgi:sterol desaturase/sphingolipid hydroxylase (fatty acid hydroxylase superfamily)